MKSCRVGPLATWRNRIAEPSIAAIVAVAFFWSSFSLYAKPQSTLGEIARDLRGPASGSVILVSSNGYGEGSFVAEMAMIEPEPHSVILRASKVLTSSSWSGNQYALLFKDDSQLAAFLDSVPVEYVVLDRTPARRAFAHTAQLASLIHKHSEAWEWVRTYSVTGLSSVAEVYRSRKPAVGGSRISLDLNYSLGRRIEKQ